MSTNDVKSDAVAVVGDAKHSLARVALGGLNVGASAFSDLAIARFCAKARESLRILESRRTKMQKEYVKFTEDRTGELEIAWAHGEPMQALADILSVQDGMQYKAEFRVSVDVRSGEVRRCVRLEGDCRTGWDIEIPYGPVVTDDLLKSKTESHREAMSDLEAEIIKFKKILSPESMADLKLQVNASVTRTALEQTEDGSSLLALTDSYVDGLVPAISAEASE